MTEPPDSRTQETAYPPISDYGYISDCHSGALVSRTGSIDWCCMPRIDSASCFGRILDWDNGGYCRISPTGKYNVSRNYLDSTLILVTTFETDSGRVRLLDFLPMREGGASEPHRQLLRIVEGLEGEMELFAQVVPRFDYGAIKPWIKQYVGTAFVAIGGYQGLLLSGNVNLQIEKRHTLSGTFRLKAGERKYLSVLYRRPEVLGDRRVDVMPDEEVDRRFEETKDWWTRWISKVQCGGPHKDEVVRSAIVLKGLQNAPTGAIAAAATTSLPEAWGKSRNWDYRFSWIRDSVFTVRTLDQIGFTSEADGFRRFVERSTAGSAEELQILFGVGGERRLYEHVIEGLRGYRGASPVRLGNAAESQVQLDVYGELLDLAWSWHKRGHSPDNDYWEFLVELVNDAAKKWKGPDQGLWEMRGEPRHFVQSKAMCWVALDRGVKLAKDLGHRHLVEEWEKSRDEIRRDVETKGYDSKRGVFTQAYGYKDLDASLLLMPIFGFVDFTDERMIRTTDAIRKDLNQNGLIRRYSADNDGMEGDEGTFLACTFWLAECLARQGRIDEAKEAFEVGLSTGNDLGLFAEEFDASRGEMMGNFPQGLTHLSLIAAAVALWEESKET
ncbi:MAG TPA: glycoside hydrolase family 15 protein [candidate division Zixibacteria bacterium]|nr:glycoside hydrolase family 15 protein [candidate division Zixibacteria bacterium]